MDNSINSYPQCSDLFGDCCCSIVDSSDLSFFYLDLALIILLKLILHGSIVELVPFVV